MTSDARNTALSGRLCVLESDPSKIKHSCILEGELVVYSDRVSHTSLTAGI